MVKPIQVNDQQVDDYLKRSDLRCYRLDQETFKQMLEYSTQSMQNDLSATYHNILDDFYNHVDQWLSATPQNITDTWGLFTLTKWCIVGSDMHHNGMMAPIEFQWRGGRWTAHPGGDRSFMTLSMPELWPVNVVIDVKEYFGHYIPDYMSYKSIKSLTDIKQIFNNWDTGLRFITPYHIDDTDHQAFMQVVMNNYRKAYNWEQDKTLFSQTYERFECKNSKSLFKQIVKCKERILDEITINTTCIEAGPWKITERGELIWNSDQVWSLQSYQ
jgi:hypothetical protein